jgi:hypothetical protein
VLSLERFTLGSEPLRVGRKQPLYQSAGAETPIAVAEQKLGSESGQRGAQRHGEVRCVVA